MVPLLHFAVSAFPSEQQMPVALAQNNNPFLTAAMAAVRRNRPMLGTRQPYDIRLESLPWGKFAQVWFLTGGCSWDACTMCDYGQGPRVDATTMVAAVDQALERLRSVDVSILLISPSGSLLDPREVPAEARQQIFQRMRSAPAPMVMFETRAETVTDEAASEAASALQGKLIAVNLGLESANPWVQRFCVNKGSDPARFVDAAATLRRHGIQTIANVSLGTGFLTPSEAIADSVATVRWALAHGADHAVLYPLQVKRHTLLGILSQLGLYRASSLWALVEALGQLDEALLPRTSISWYRNYYGDAFLEGVTSCPRCEARVLRLLDSYRGAQSAAALAPLQDFRCACRVRWREGLSQAAPPLSQRVLETYHRLAQVLDLQDTWTSQRAEVTSAMTQTLVPIGDPARMV